jgi:predicted ATPase
MPRYPFINSLKIEGYKVFREFQATLGPLEVIVGSNGSGKTSLFEFLRILRDGVSREIPSEIVRSWTGQRVFHKPGADKFSWGVLFGFPEKEPLVYAGDLLGPVGRPEIAREGVLSVPAQGEKFVFLKMTKGQGAAHESGQQQPWALSVQPNALGLGSMTNPKFTTLFGLREHISRWQFYNSLDIATYKNIATYKIRAPVPIEQEPVLREDAGNLSSVLHYLMTEYRNAADELEEFVRLAIPGFRKLTVRAFGGHGSVMAFWEESGVDDKLSLADLSDGTLRFLCWAVLCVHPHPPSLVCIDEPDMGIHPRAQALLAGMFQKASERTQFILATHGSYFLMQFDISQIAVLRKEGGEAKFVSPADSKALIANLEEFGREEIELMHRNEELEHLA